MSETQLTLLTAILSRLSKEAEILESNRLLARQSIIDYLRDTKKTNKEVIIKLAKLIEKDDFYACAWLILHSDSKNIKSRELKEHIGIVDKILLDAGVKPKWILSI